MIDRSRPALLENECMTEAGMAAPGIGRAAVFSTIALVMLLAACDTDTRVDTGLDLAFGTATASRQAWPGHDLLRWTQAVQSAPTMRVNAAANEPLPFVETRRFCSTTSAGESHCTIYECSSNGESISCIEYYVSARAVDGDAAGSVEGALPVSDLARASPEMLASSTRVAPGNASSLTAGKPIQ